MCGIIGYISKKENSNSLKIGIEALKRLEYRGYDSSGFAAWNSDKKEIFSQKAIGRIANLEEKIKDYFSYDNPIILHTRWATHGLPNETNTHPHCGCEKNLWVVHNGIIENYKALKKQLEKEGHKFRSETDSEVLAHLIEKYSEENSLEEAVIKSLKLVKGTYGILVISKKEPEKIIAAKLSSPLILGIGDNEFILASDPAAILTHTKKVIYLEDKEIAVITPRDFKIINLDGEKKIPKMEKLDWTLEESQKGGFSHFMLKEIFEEPEAIRNSIRGRLIPEDGLAKLGGLESVTEKLKEIERLNIVACGTARHACKIGEYMLEEYAGIPVEVEAGSEFRYRKQILDKKGAVLVVSQSGETADTLEAIREAKEKGMMCLGIVNVVGSTISRKTGAGIYNHAGPEIAVVSTKAFTSQLAVFALLTLFLGRQREMSLVMGQRIAKELLKIPELVEKIFKSDTQIKEIAEKYKSFDNLMYIGRKYNFPIAKEGAHKIKETAYIHGEGLRAGELKHCELALIDENFPTIAICPSDSVYEKNISNIEEIKARKGKIIAIATEGNKEIKNLADDVIYIPKTLEMLTPILSVIPLQLFAYYAGILRGYDVDRPRNLAKSVTVE